MINRIVWIILDSVGIGELPDAEEYHDVGSNTLGNLSKAVGGLHIPNMRRLGLGNIEGMINIEPVREPEGCFGRLGEISKGKDTTTGHWEMIGIYSKQAFPTYPNGFPQDIIDQFKKAVHIEGILGNCTASGTEIIKQYGEEHRKTGYPIVYTSADSVFQIACHEEVIPVEVLYNMCIEARKILTGDNAVARVIARPFLGIYGSFERTPNRRDFSLKPSDNNLLVRLKEKQHDVIAIGKIEDIFAKVGITKAVHTKDNMDGIEKTIEYIRQDNKGIIFTNLVEFDMKWGHRNDILGYAKGLEEFDRALPRILSEMKEDDLLIINADHGCDPTTESTDHSREYVPLLLYGKNIKGGVDLKTGKTFANIGQTIAEIFHLEPLLIGESFWKQIKQ